MSEAEASHPTPEKPHRSSGSEFWRFSLELIKTALVVVVLAYVIRLFVLQPFIVEGASMDPLFQTNDYLLIDKISYRLNPPDRGDIVVFRYPNDPSLNYVKRVIGLPGEKVHIGDGKVTIFNEKNPEGIVLNEPYILNGRETNPTVAGKTDFTVPKDSYFVLGDNRPGSSDSREWDELPSSYIVGRVLVQIYPINRFAFFPHADSAASAY